MTSIRLRAVKGPLRGHTFDLKPGSRCVIGRDPTASISTIDSELARLHCAIESEGAQVRLINLCDAGTFINGERADATELSHGDRIQAGRCEFVVEIRSSAIVVGEPGTHRGPLPGDRGEYGKSERTAPPARVTQPIVDASTPHHLPSARGPLIEIFAGVEPTLGQDRPEPARNGTKCEVLVGALSPLSEGLRLYAIVDGAQNFELAFVARLMGLRLFTLLPGELAEVLSDVGPCVIPIPRSERAIPAYLVHWADHLGESAGVLFETASSLEDVGQHLRKLLVETDTGGSEYIFRFYDPRVFREFFGTCPPEGQAEFCGPIRRWVVEDMLGQTYEAHVKPQAKG